MSAITPRSLSKRLATRMKKAGPRPFATSKAGAAVGRAVVNKAQQMAVARAAQSLRDALARDAFVPNVQRAPAAPAGGSAESAPPPPASRPLSYDGGVAWQPGVEELQRYLVANGFMTAEEMATGPGFYGPRTRAAVARMNAAQGISSDGSTYGGAPTAGFAPVNAFAAPGAPSEVPLIDQRWPNGATSSNYWNANANCGPASAAMVARALGFGQGLSDAELVMKLKAAGGTTEAGSSPAQVQQMMKSLGVPSTLVEDPGLAHLDAALAQGKLVIANGDYFATGVSGRNGAQESGHFMVVTGKDANGNYICNDPWKGERVVFTPQAMTNFFREHDYQGALVVVDQPVKTTAPAPSPTSGMTATGSVQLSAADEATAARVDQVLASYSDSKMHGMGRVIVAACRRERVPLDLVLAQIGKESTFLRSDNTLSIANNNPANLRFAEWERKFGGEPGVGGFTRFPSIEAGINAYVHLLGSPDLPYRQMIDRRDWASMVKLFAPASDGNDVATYVRQIEEWTAYFAQKVGIDSNWVNT